MPTTQSRALPDNARAKAEKYFLKGFKNIRKLEPDEFPKFQSTVQTLAYRAKIRTPHLYLAYQPKKLRATDNTLTIYTSESYPAIRFTQNLVENSPPKEIEGVVGHELGHFIFRQKEGLKYGIIGLCAIVARLAAWIGGSIAINHELFHSPGVLKRIGVFIGMHIATKLIKAALFDFRLMALSEKMADRESVRLVGNGEGLKASLSSDKMKAHAEQEYSYYKFPFRLIARLFLAPRFDLWPDATFAAKNKVEKALGKALHAIFYNTPSMSERLRLIDKYVAELGKGNSA